MNTTSIPTSSLRAPVDRRFAVFVAVSVGLHVGVVVGYGLWDARQVAVLEMPTEPIKATLVRLGKKRDEKLLPRLDTAPKPAPAEKPKATPVPVKDTPPPVEKAVPVPLKDDKKAPPPDKAEKEERQKTVQSALDKIREQVAREDERSKALGRIADRVGKEEEEPEGDEKGSPDGDSATPSQVNAYFGAIGAAVRRNFVVPTVLESKCAGMVAQVMVRMDAAGTVVDVRIIKRSGEELFDSAVVAAVKNASPLPPAPSNMREMVTKGFGFNFRCDK